MEIQQSERGSDDGGVLRAREKKMGAGGAGEEARGRGRGRERDRGTGKWEQRQGGTWPATPPATQACQQGWERKGEAISQPDLQAH